MEEEGEKMEREEEETHEQPSHDEVQELLLATDGDPTKLLKRYPYFDANERPPNNSFPYLFSACLRNLPAATRGLLALGADVQMRTLSSYGAFPLYYACNGLEESRAKLVSVLLTHSRDARETVNWGNNDDNTPLNRAILYGNIAVVRVLLAHCADLTLRYHERTPAQFAFGKGYMEIAELLEVAERAQAVLSIGEWRPHKQACFPITYREAMQTLVVLAKARDVDLTDSSNLVSHYPQACLDLLPEEVLQFLFALTTVAPVPGGWTL